MTLQQLLPEVPPEELAELRTITAKMSGDQIESFCSSYRAQRKEAMMILLLAIFLGAAGVHRFVLGQTGMGVLYLFSLGLFGIGVLLDAINHKKLTTQRNLDVARKIAGATV